MSDVAETEVLQVLDGRGQAGGHRKAAAERVVAEGQVEDGLLLADPRLPVAVGHRQLVEIGRAGPARACRRSLVQSRFPPDRRPLGNGLRPLSLWERAGEGIAASQKTTAFFLPPSP